MAGQLLCFHVQVMTLSDMEDFAFPFGEAVSDADDRRGRVLREQC